MESNACVDCSFGSVNIEVFVPENFFDIQQFVHQARLFASKVTAFAEQKPIHYTLKFDSKKDSSELSFNIKCSCMLNADQRDCSNFNQVEGSNCRVKDQENNLKRERQIEVIQTI